VHETAICPTRFHPKREKVGKTDYKK